ncbi:hypothetical protein FACS189425_10480 [Clostridia bacterium]|nr:hypothetical protein FACS189425_10480 [Clostridia bacterium]
MTNPFITNPTPDEIIAIALEQLVENGAIANVVQLQKAEHRARISSDNSHNLFVDKSNGYTDDFFSSLVKFSHFSYEFFLQKYSRLKGCADDPSSIQELRDLEDAWTKAMSENPIFVEMLQAASQGEQEINWHELSDQTFNCIYKTIGTYREKQHRASIEYRVYEKAKNATSAAYRELLGHQSIELVPVDGTESDIITLPLDTGKWQDIICKVINASGHNHNVDASIKLANDEIRQLTQTPRTNASLLHNRPIKIAADNKLVK